MPRTTLRHKAPSFARRLTTSAIMLIKKAPARADRFTDVVIPASERLSGELSWMLRAAPGPFLSKIGGRRCGPFTPPLEDPARATPRSREVSLTRTFACCSDCVHGLVLDRTIWSFSIDDMAAFEIAVGWLAFAMLVGPVIGRWLKRLPETNKILPLDHRYDRYRPASEDLDPPSLGYVVELEVDRPDNVPGRAERIG